MALTGTLDYKRHFFGQRTYFFGAWARTIFNGLMNDLGWSHGLVLDVDAFHMFGTRVPGGYTFGNTLSLREWLCYDDNLGSGVGLAGLAACNY